ncbi:MAG: histidinol-phosphate transaminase [Fulvivirga sp.]|nr:histidinol-phosphate transaminase [Fulvivirga sp.]
MKAYSSARDEYSGTNAILLDANENPFESEVNRYPDPYQRRLKEKISEIKKVPPSQIFLGNGSDEAIDLILRIFCEPGVDNIVSIDPSYGMYQVAADIHNINVIKAPLKSDFSLQADEVIKCADSHTKIIMLCSPNNPSGNLLESAKIEQIISQFHGIVVLDEAYIDFAQAESFIHRLDKYPNLIVLQTFSKAWGMAGVRLGLAYASEEIIRLFNKVKPPYNINQLTQDFVFKKLNQLEVFEAELKEVVKERDRLSQALDQLEITEHVYPSDSNFLLVRFRQAERIFNNLYEQKIILRDRSRVRYGKDCLRITVGTRHENDKLLEALKNEEKSIIYR